MFILFCFVLVSTAPQQKPVSTYTYTYIHLPVKSDYSLFNFSNCNISFCFFLQQFFIKDCLGELVVHFFVPFSITDVVMYFNVKDSHVYKCWVSLNM